MAGNGVKYWPHTGAAPKNDFDSSRMQVVYGQSLGVYEYLVPLSNV